MSRALFVYWKTEAGTAGHAASALRAWHDRLRQDHPSLQASLYRRADDAGAPVTLMETYALPGGVGAALQQRLLAEGDAVCAPWRQGRRHVEVFEPWPEPFASDGTADPAPRQPG